LLGNGDGTFQAPQSYDVSLDDASFSIAVADLNRDGILDLAVATNTLGSVIILLGKGDGTFQAPQSYYGGAHA
jgi:hypothetical protein